MDDYEWHGRPKNGGAPVRIGYNSDEILKYLKARIARALPNLWINQGGGIETLAGLPLALNEMLLQSYEGTVCVFPNWNHKKDASFYRLRMYGAFVVSCVLKNVNILYVNW